MKLNKGRFAEVVEIFPKLRGILAKLQESNINFLIGGSVSLYIQGNARLPHDVDLMFPVEEHKKANKVFGIEMGYIERPNVRMSKSSPLSNEEIDFLSNYTVIADGKQYFSPPKEKVELVYKDLSYNLVPAGKIALYKLVGRRLHHNDIEDVKRLIQDPNFDRKLFWAVADSIGAVDIVASLARQYHIVVPNPLSSGIDNGSVKG